MNHAHSSSVMKLAATEIVRETHNVTANVDLESVVHKVWLGCRNTLEVILRISSVAHYYFSGHQPDWID